LTLQRQVTDLRTAVSSLQTSNGQLQAAVAALQTSNGQLQTAVAALQSNVGTLQAIDGKLQLQINALRGNSVLALNGKLNLSPDGTTALFSGVNVQLVNGPGKHRDHQWDRQPHRRLQRAKSRFYLSSADLLQRHPSGSGKLHGQWRSAGS
jgi:hypothetical protein